MAVVSSPLAPTQAASSQLQHDHHGRQAGCRDLLIHNLPPLLSLNRQFLEVMLEEAGFAEYFLGLEAIQHNSVCTGSVRVRMSSILAANKCARHLRSCRWLGAKIMISVVRPEQHYVPAGFGDERESAARSCDAKAQSTAISHPWLGDVFGCGKTKSRSDVSTHVSSSGSEPPMGEGAVEDISEVSSEDGGATLQRLSASKCLWSDLHSDSEEE